MLSICNCQGNNRYGTHVKLIIALNQFHRFLPSPILPIANAKVKVKAIAKANANATFSGPIFVLQQHAFTRTYIGNQAKIIREPTLSIRWTYAGPTLDLRLNYG